MLTWKIYDARCNEFLRPAITLSCMQQENGVDARDKLKIGDFNSDPSCLESSNCTLSESSMPAIIVTDSSDDDTVSGVWLQTPLYRLINRDKELIHAPTSWLNDSVILNL